MDIFYINQASASDRRGVIEEMLQRLGLHGRVERFEALGPENFNGIITDAEIGCFRSHVQLIETMIGQHRIIFEDDVLIDDKFAPMLPAIESHLEGGCEILFFATLHPYVNVLSTLELLRVLDHLNENSGPGFFVLNGKRFYRSGAIGYAVNINARDKILKEAGLSSVNGYGTPIDNLYFKMIQDGVLNAGLIFPFLIGCSVAPSQLDGRRNDGFQELYDEHINLFSRITDKEKMLQDLLSWATSRDLDRENLIASLLQLKHLELARANRY